MDRKPRCPVSRGIHLIWLAGLACTPPTTAVRQPVEVPDLQTQINAGGIVHIPTGRYVLARAGLSYHALVIPAGVTLIGEGRDSTILQLAPGTAPSVRLLEIVGDGVTIQSLTLDGDRAEQTADEHRAGIFARGAGLTVRDVMARDFTGDGVDLYNGANNATIDQLVAQGNGRNGLTLNGMITGVAVTASTFQGNAAQQFDSEPGSPAHVDNVTIRGSTFDGLGVSSDYVLTVCGTAGAQSRGWTIEGNVINGGLYAVWASDFAVRGNTGVNPTAKASVTLYRTISGALVDGNDLTATAAASAIAVLGTGTGQAASDVAITSNRVTAGGSMGVRVDGAVSIAIIGNTLTNAHGLGDVAVALRATNPAAPFQSAEVRDNHGTGWTRGISLGGMVGTTATIGMLTATGNVLGPLYLDDGSGALQGALVTGDVARWPVGAVLSTSTTMTRQ